MLSYTDIHPSGFCDVAYIEGTDKQVYLITCGQDGKLCYRSAEKPSEVIKSFDAKSEGESNSPLTCVVASPAGDRVAVSNEQNFVQVGTSNFFRARRSTHALHSTIKHTGLHLP